MEKTKTDECITGSSGTPGTPTRRRTSEIPRMRSAFSFLAVKIAVCRADCARRPCGLVGGKKSSSLRSGIFSRQALPQSPANRLQGQQEIKMPTKVGRCLTKK